VDLLGDPQVVLPTGIRGRNPDQVALLAQMNQEVARGIANLNSFCRVRTNVAKLVWRLHLPVPISVTVPPLQTEGLQLRSSSSLNALRISLTLFSMLFDHFFSITKKIFHSYFHVTSFQNI
jgi:hypothetical protein